MPRIPKWIGDTMESVFSRMIIPVKVTRVEYILSGLKRIIMEGDFSKVKYVPGNVIEFRVTDTDFRHYTISAFDKEKNTCEMLVYLHGRGVGSQWAKNIQVGDSLKMMGPGGKIKYNRNSTKHFVFGDETSIGLMQSIAKEAADNQHPYYCLAELDKENFCWIAQSGFNAVIVEKEYEPAAKDAVEKILAMDASFWEDWSNAAFYITGRAKSIQAVRKALLSKNISMRNIQTEPYWAEGKKGL